MINRILLIIAVLFFATSAAFCATVKVSWDPNSEPDLAGYKIYHGTASGSYGNPVDVGNVTEHLMQVTPQYGTTYYFALTAYDTSGNESGYSDEASVFVPDGSAPAKPKGILARLVDAVVGWIKGLFGLLVTVV
jgi:hypothetical protein